MVSKNADVIFFVIKILLFVFESPPEINQVHTTGSGALLAGDGRKNLSAVRY